MLEPAPIFATRKLDSGLGWVIDAVWTDEEIEQLIGVYITKEHAVDWIAQRSTDWLEGHA
ncbi:hypothetical protein [Tardiphaga sp. P9-11]|uniref:hypothetical protein n=1 Tax=Tardiphaga sp. P9-11 TaxID=2024614 RepID=UPI0011F16056|nr:hypothetical protein [Tardiphaga sp. P9-11]KAA0075200.1 hypothetical protein CIW50_14095 [Tardiphaga sp. P9-11]